jgi:hypothetical protein
MRQVDRMRAIFSPLFVSYSSIDDSKLPMQKTEAMVLSLTVFRRNDAAVKICFSV